MRRKNSDWLCEGKQSWSHKAFAFFEIKSHFIVGAGKASLRADHLMLAGR